mmetsp:Transcript_37437/g.56039  ORF Transcript_37437/g.56039 Transcript_37437/m.56039 type:complete len:165 (-) Transcript_37437:16-510(-)
MARVEPVVQLTKQEREKGMTSIPKPPINDLSLFLNGGGVLFGEEYKEPLKPLVDAAWMHEEEEEEEESYSDKKNAFISKEKRILRNNHAKKGVVKKPQQLRLILQEGRKHQIKRMCREFLGYHVTELVRIRIGNVLLRDLPMGMWRPLNENEVRFIFHSKKKRK